MTTPANNRKTIVLIGHGMVGHRFCERMIEFDVAKQYRIVTFCEEPRAAYDRVGLTSFFAHRSAHQLMLANLDWYRDHGIEIYIGDRATKIDRKKRIVTSDQGREIPYDIAVLATGSFPFVPNVPGVQIRGVFVYRTIEHLQSIIDYGAKSKRAAVIGGGLLGLETAKAAYDLGLETHVIEFAPRLMPRQIDDAGSRTLVRKIENLGVRVHLNKATKEIVGNGAVEGLVFNDGERLDVDMVIVSAGIRPRDDLARECGIEVGERGGVKVDDKLCTSDPSVFAIGEVALHSGFVYGLVAPGYDMAETVAANLCGQDKRFTGADLSTKLKLMGIDVASFGNYEASAEVAKPLVFEDPFAGVYKKLLFDHEGKHLVGGILVGDASEYGMLAAMQKSGEPLAMAPGELIVGQGGAAGGVESLSDACQICSCNNVTKGQLCTAIREQNLTTIGAVKSCTKAGTGCGGCMPLVTDILNKELAAAGKSVNRDLCEHFPHTRQQLFEIVKIKKYRTFDELLASHGKGNGCEICKPAVASILASLWNDQITDRPHHTLQDTNDRFLANMQRGGLYSIVPRVPGGEITPDKLVTLGQVAKKYGLYTKITGGQRIDLFGAQVHQLPEIWEELVDAGFESGHAYGKALRTVKSCVGTTWCRYGVQDSVGFAIRVEERYRGIRAPHKLKGGVSGCIRECAEAQSKDFGLIATEKGYNLYVCGNGGSKPRHADLLAGDLDAETTIKYLDRFLMYYIQTADRLTRTSVWLENMEGGIEHLRNVVVHDSLGIAGELERRIQHLVDTYKCEWAEVVRDPARRRMFEQFVNTSETQTGIEIVTERGQHRPADWPKDGVRLEDIKLPNGARLGENVAASLVASSNGNGRANGNGHAATDHPALAATGALAVDDRPSPRRNGRKLKSRNDGRGQYTGPTWVRVGVADDFPLDGGATIKYGDVQIAVYNFASRGEWYASQNMCPHKNAFVLARGILGSQGETPKVACPLHKKTFSLASGECTSGDDFAVKVFPVCVVRGDVFLLLPPRQQLNALLGTSHHCISSCDAPKAREFLTARVSEAEPAMT